MKKETWIGKVYLDYTFWNDFQTEFGYFEFTPLVFVQPFFQGC